MTIREIKDAIEEGQALKSIASAYTEIASLRLKRIRQDVLKTRAFFSEVLRIYALVRRIAQQKGQKANLKPKLSILISSNDRFYSIIDTNLVSFFLSQGSDKGETFVVGHGAKVALEARGFKNFTAVTLKKDMPTQAELANIVTKAKQYQSVLVYYPQFQTVIKQSPVAVDITQSQAKALEQSKRIEGAFIFEPEAPKILEFFDNQIKQTLIEQTFLEADLARVGSRLISMDSAQHNADDFVSKEKVLLGQAKRSLQNVRILETVASMRNVATI